MDTNRNFLLIKPNTPFNIKFSALRFKLKDVSTNPAPACRGYWGKLPLPPMTPRFILIILLFVALTVPALGQEQKIYEVSGPARPLDADVLVVAETHPPIRLYGIDAPEKLQPCWLDDKPWACNAVATRTLLLLIEHHEVTCRQVKDDNRRRRGKIYAVCTAGGKDLAEEMVRAGMAVAFREQSMNYVEAEAEASAAKVGIWAGKFLPPWEWVAEENFGG